MSFEYDVISLPILLFSWKPEEKIKKFLNEKNVEGWELVEMVRFFWGSNTFVFKREKY